MMKRIFILLAVLLISTITLAAEIKSLSSDSFEIKGYKITGSDDVEFIITDAISESLNTFQQSNTSGGDVSVPVGEIDATSHMGTFLSDTADISADNVDKLMLHSKLITKTLCIQMALKLTSHTSLIKKLHQLLPLIKNLSYWKVQSLLHQETPVSGYSAVQF